MAEIRFAPSLHLHAIERPLRVYGGQGLLFGAGDGEPEHCRQLSPHQRLGYVEDLALVPWEKQTGKAERQVAEARDHEPDAEEAGEKARFVHQQAEWKEP